LGLLGLGIGACNAPIDEDVIACNAINAKKQAQQLIQEKRRVVAAVAKAARDRAVAIAQRQQSLPSATRDMSCKAVDDQWACAFYRKGMAHHISSESEFHKAVQVTSQLFAPSGQGDDKPMYTPSTRHRLSGPLLLCSDADLQAETAASMASDFLMFGAIYTGDGWSSASQLP
jgi:hypothetical protein